MPPVTTSPTHPRWLTTLLLAYVALAIYGSLYPLADWRPASSGLIEAFAQSLRGHASRADMVTNLLVYMPLGLMLALRWQTHLNLFALVLAATVAGFGLSLTMEWIQLYLPSRTTSVIDLFLNTLGTGLGAMLPLLLSDRFTLGRRLHDIRVRWVETGPTASFGLIAIGVWAMSQLTPFVPSLDVGTLREGLSPLYHTALDPLSFAPDKALAYALTLLAITLIALTLVRSDQPHRWRVPGLLVATVLLAKIPIVARSLSAEAVVGAVIAIAGLRVLERVEFRQLLAIIVFCLIGAHAVEQLRPAAGPVIGDVQWRLFSMQMLNIHGLQDILADIWPFLGLAYVARRAGLPGTAPVVVGGAVMIGAVTGILEWAQSAIPGRYADATDVLLALAGWTLPWLYPAFRNTENRPFSR